VEEVTLPQPGQWVRVRHACPDVTHDEPVEVVAVTTLQLITPGVYMTTGYRITTRRCDGGDMNLYADRDGVPVAGDEWEVVT
jgi:hypothetical protein